MTGHAMAYTLTQAAEVAKVGRSTVFKWIKAGKISGKKVEDGTLRIDPAELHRFLDSVAKETSPVIPPKQAATADEPVSDMAMELVSLRSQLQALQQILEMERERGREWREDRDAWKHQAERLAIAPPAPPAPTPTPPAPAEARGWWPWGRRAS